MAADLQAVGVLAHVIGVVDGPAREPEHLALELAQDVELVRGRKGFVRHVESQVVSFVDLPAFAPACLANIIRYNVEKWQIPLRNGL